MVSSLNDWEMYFPQTPEIIEGEDNRILIEYNPMQKTTVMKRMRTNCPSKPQYHNMNVLVDTNDKIGSHVTIYFTSGSITSLMVDESMLLDGWGDGLKDSLTQFCRSWINNNYPTPNNLTAYDIIDMLDVFDIDTTDAKAYFTKLRCLSMSDTPREPALVRLESCANCGNLERFITPSIGPHPTIGKCNIHQFNVSAGYICDKWE